MKSDQLAPMCYRTIILIGLFILTFKSLSGQCPESDFVLKKISYLRDSSGLSPVDQIKELLPYESKSAKCMLVDSVLVQLLQRLGKLFYQASDYTQGITFFEKCIALIRRNGQNRSVSPKDLVPAYYGLNACYDSLGRVLAKMSAIDSCIAISMRLKSIDVYCLWALYRRAEYSFDIGDYHRCIEYSTLCESLATELADKGSKQDAELGKQYAISSLLQNVNALILLTRYDDAQKLLEKKADECKAKKLEHNLGVIYGSLAEVLELKGDFEKVLLYHNKAFEIEKRSGYPVNCKAMLNDLGYEVWFQHYKNPDKALEYYNKALNYKVTGDEMLNSLESLSILNRIANVYVLKGKYDDALKYMQQAFDQIKPGTTEIELLQTPLDEFIGKRRTGYIATLIVDKAAALHQKYKFDGNPDNIREAIRIYKVADRFLEKIKNEQSDLQSKLFWRSDRRRLYEMAIEACHAYSSTTDAFYFFERSRAVLLSDQLNELHLMNKEDLIIQERLKKSIARLERQTAAENKTSQRAQKLQEEMLKNRQELDALSKQINTRNPLYQQNFTSTDYNILHEVQHGLLKGNDKLVEFFDGDSAVYSIIVTPDEVFLQKINKDSFDYAVSQFVSYVSNYALINKNFQSFEKISYQLYELIFQHHPMPPGKIIISPDGHYFPVEALLTSKDQSQSYLIKTHPVSYAHSARLLMMDSPASTGTDVKNFLGMAPVNFDKGLNLPSLTGSDISLKTLTANFKNADNLTFSQASKNNFILHFPKYDIVQLYTHAANNENAGEPEIYLADSVLHLSELITRQMPFTKLIVLAACETGTGEWFRGEGVFSFNRGVAALGVGSCVTNLWSVDNTSTYRLTELFYKHVASGLPIDVALQKAKLEFISLSSKEKSLPYFWAAPVLAGKTNALTFDNPFPWKQSFIASIACSFILFIAFLWRRRRNNGTFLN